MYLKLCSLTNLVVVVVIIVTICQTIVSSNLIESDSFCESPSISKRYVIINKPLIWHEAQEYCEAHNMTLATVETVAEHAEMKNIIDESKCLGAWLWIGANDPLRNGKFKWVSNNQPLSYVAWAHNQPNRPRVANCVASYVPQNRWHSQLCGMRAPFACEMFMRDRVPTIESRRKRYIVVNKPLIWHEALEYCNAHKMNMANVESISEHAEIRKVLDESKCLGAWVWVGANAPNLDAKFTWSSNNQPLNFAPWAVHQPSRPRVANCVSVFVPNNQWHSQLCSLRIQFICEAYTVTQHCKSSDFNEV